MAEYTLVDLLEDFGPKAVAQSGILDALRAGETVTPEMKDISLKSIKQELRRVQQDPHFKWPNGQVSNQEHDIKSLTKLVSFLEGLRTASMKAMDTLAKLKRVARSLEETNPQLSLRVSQLTREVLGAKATDVKMDSWDDFAAWWNANRSQGLLFTLVDSLGEDNPVIEKMRQVMQQQDELERSLHDIYLTLRNGGQAPAPAAAPDAGGLDATEPLAEEPLEAPPADAPVDDLVDEAAAGV